ncbi:GNAT family N-acetyltransferase [Saccharopolyspora sp. TS4A08]|uniref:GNAT family N-acetyltransferase n=1 Tax=Saccharopolyspora ipomoeae TaxID=3042027 RepID=A0ABT6PLI2_9PSEU|nr:GNAT family N-acetyltransferase [Saccharopolyspora sp. TS4A08]MDI2028862.1 GNAT family N-acetyltransferase [Saccharopolyspora sp. TS4A08]
MVRQGGEYQVGEYSVRRAAPDDVEGARSLMLDTFYREMGTGYVPAFHVDVIDLERTYLRTPGQALFVAERGGEVVATGGVRSGGPKSPPNPLWLAEHYARGATAQLVRTYVRPAHRRRGLARALVDLCCEFAAESGYDTAYLHTNPEIDGAEPFWRSLAKEVLDERPDGEPVVHFEIALPQSRS